MRLARRVRSRKRPRDRRDVFQYFACELPPENRGQTGRPPLFGCVSNNRPRRSILLMTIQPRNSTIPCKILYFPANPRYHSLCSPRPPPPRQIIPRASARSIPFGVILSVAKDLLLSSFSPLLTHLSHTRHKPVTLDTVERP